MLWQKSSDHLYIDLAKDSLKFVDNFRFDWKKNTALSLQARQEGNEFFSKKDFKSAMDKYNESIRFADDLNSLSVSYANRSSCFFHLQMYDRCLADMALAKSANYPQSLMHKLDDRELKCMNKMQSNASLTVAEPKLSFEADDKLPSMVNALRIDSNEKYGRFITAKRDIPIGETILVEESYVHKSFGPKVNKCTNCGKKEMNFIPCKNCSGVMFCSENCSNNIFHDVECGMVFGADDFVNGESLRFILRSVIIAIATFETTAEMMEFVSNCRNSEPLEIGSCENLKQKYRTFFKLAASASGKRIRDFTRIGYIILKTIMGSKMGARFETTASQRFLLHLIVHHALVLHTNSFGGLTAPGSEWNETTNSAHSDKEHESKLYLLTSYFNHSCLPNIIKLEKDNVAVCKTLVPIKEGAQLFLTYIEDEAFTTTKEITEHLDNWYGFRCSCQRCVVGMSMTAQIRDENFNYVRANIEIGKFDENSIAQIKKRCIAFILKYSQMAATVEGNFIVSNFGAMLQKEIDLQ